MKEDTRETAAKIVLLVVMISVLAVTFFVLSACGDAAPRYLSGKVTITPNTNVDVGTELTASYSGLEKVDYQWQRGKTNVGTNSNKYTPTEAGSYTVTVSAIRYVSLTSSPVTVAGSGGGEGGAGGGGECSHEYDSEWHQDSTHHYHVCTLCGNEKDAASHSGDPCSVCGYEEHEHTFGSAWSKNNTSHWKECTNVSCDQKSSEANHSYNWVETTPATISAANPPVATDGVETKTCTLCGATDGTRPITYQSYFFGNWEDSTITIVVSQGKIRIDLKDPSEDHFELDITSWTPYSMDSYISSSTGNPLNLTVDSGTQNAEKPNYPSGYHIPGTIISQQGLASYHGNQFSKEQ